MKRRFARRTLAAIKATKYLYVRAGATHRFVPIWVVVVTGRVLVRSWNDKLGGWYRAFRREKHGAVRIGEREIAVRAVAVRSARLSDGADRAYGEKYTTTANQPYVRGFATKRRKAATLELAPAPGVSEHSVARRGTRTARATGR